MLEIRPNCENCDIDLAVESENARICSYECTFCKSCVDDVLKNVCPNCGGGFVPRPIRPRTAYRDKTSREFQKTSSTRVHTSYSQTQISEFSNSIKAIIPKDR